MHFSSRLTASVSTIVLGLSLATMPAQAQPASGSIPVHSIEQSILPVFSVVLTPLSLLSSLIIHSGH